MKDGIHGRCIVQGGLSQTKRKKTNTVHIQSMSEEELAKFLHMVDQNEGAIPYCKDHGPCDDLLENGEEIPEEMCIQCMMNWLQSEMEE